MAGTLNQANGNSSEAREPAHLRPLADNLAALTSAAVSLALFTIATARPGIWPAAIFAPLPVLAVAPELTDRRAGAIAFFAYLIGAVLAWPAEVGSAPLLVVAAAHAASAAWFAAVVILAAEATRRWAGWMATLVYPTLITLVWFALGEVSPYGTWGSPAYGVATYTPLMQLAAFAGLSSVTFVSAFIPAALAVAYYRRRWGLGWEHLAITPFALFVVLSAAGGLRLLFGGHAAPVKIGVGATDQGIEFSQATQVKDAAGAIALFQPIVHDLAASGAQVVVLPEKIIGVTPADQDQVSAGFAAVARAEHVWLVVGWNLIERTPMVNLAAAYSPDGALVASYAKRRPIGGLEDGYQAGSRTAVFDAPWGRTALMIGRDLDFPELGREVAAEGAVLVLAPAWDPPGASAIRARMTSALAVESGFSIARAARHGESAIYDSCGRTFAYTSTLSSDPAIAVAELSPGSGATFYARHGEWFGWVTMLAALVIVARLAVGALIDRRRRGTKVEWRQVEVRLGGTPQARTSAPAAEEGNEVLHYRR